MGPDPDDDLVLETAVTGHAEVVLTFNRRHFEPAAARFGIEILAPAEARLTGKLNAATVGTLRLTELNSRWWQKPSPEIYAKVGLPPARTAKNGEVKFLDLPFEWLVMNE